MNKTTEPCPTCQAPAQCEHGIRDGWDDQPLHVWDCPNCGRYTVILGWNCPACVALGQGRITVDIALHITEPTEYERSRDLAKLHAWNEGKPL